MAEPFPDRRERQERLITSPTLGAAAKDHSLACNRGRHLGVSRNRKGQGGHKDENMNAVPIVSIVFAVGLPLSIPIVYLFLNYHKRRRLIELHHAERMAAIERGMEIPPLPLEIWGTRRSRTTLLPGLIWLFIGLALMAALHEVKESVWGLVPTGIGVAFLIHYLIEGRKGPATKETP
jgi:hypothetical protein